MKKTIFTVMTAAMFAASNLSAIPSDAADDNGNRRPKVDPVENITLSNPDWNKEDESVTGITTTAVAPERLVNLTTTAAQLLYGSPWTFGLTTTANGEKVITTKEKKTTTTTTAATTALEKLTATTTVTLYGVMPSRTTADDHWNEEIARMKGDVNEDNVIDTFDAIALRRAILHDEYKSQRQYLLSDINSDGKVDVTDLVLLQRFLLGAVKDFSEYNNAALSNKTTTKDPETTTTVTTSYDPRNDIIISLYGIKPSIDKIHEIYNDAVDDMIKAAEIAETETPEVE